MVKILYGNKGSGKTAKLVATANEKATGRGSVVFITDSWRNKFELKYQIRLVNVTEYGVSTPEALGGFIEGMLAVDSDIANLYIDCAHRMFASDFSHLEDFFGALESISEKHGLDVAIAVGCDELPSYMDRFDKEKA